MLKLGLLAIGFLILFALVLASPWQRSLIYFPSLEKPNPEEFHAEDMRVIQIPVAEGLILSSWYKPPLDKKPVILYLHGNAGHIGYRMRLLRQFIDAGFGVLLLEYRGYGGNPGTPTEMGFYQDGRAAMQFLQQQGIPDNKIVLYGESLGTGVATQLATEFSACALVLQSPYTSLTALARYHYFGLPLPVLDKYDSLSRVQEIHTPLLVLHGKLDHIVPYTQGLTLFDFANQPKKWVEFPTKGHHDLWDGNFVSGVIDFISAYCPRELE